MRITFLALMLLAGVSVKGQFCDLLGNDTTLCTGQSVLLDAGAGLSYNWSTGATSQTIGVSAAGIFFVEVNTGSGLCHDTIEVFISPQVYAGIASSGSVNLCQGDSVVFSGSGGTQFQWLFNNAPIAGETQNTFSAVNPGDYAVIVNGPGNCPDTSLTFAVTWFPPFIVSITATDTFLCPGDTVFLSTGGASVLQWFLNGVPMGSGSAFSATLPGVYVIEVQNANGCSAFDTIVIFNGGNPIVNVTAADDTLCAGGPLFLSASGAETWQWLLNGIPIAGANDSVYASTTGGNYAVIGFTSCGVDTSASLSLFSWPDPGAEFQFQQFPDYHVHFFDESISAVTWQWNFPTDTSFQQNPWTSFGAQGSYPVVLIITNERGCTDTAFSTIELQNDSVVIPNVFTPNGDGINDFFIMQPGILESGELCLFDRWGSQLLCISVSPLMTWDGANRNGQPVPSGVYFYQLNGLMPGGVTKQEAGTITLLR